MPGVTSQYYHISNLAEIIYFYVTGSKLQHSAVVEDRPIPAVSHIHINVKHIFLSFICCRL